MPQCTVGGCDKPTRSKSSPLCKMHYHRQYRHGDVNKTGRGKTTRSTPLKYRKVPRPGHPLAIMTGNPSVWEHRAVLYDKVGPGPVPCHYCGDLLQWEKGGPLRPIESDHLNRNGLDNRPENLVACCRPCNLKRARSRRMRLLRDEGWYSENDTIAHTAKGRKTVV